MVMGSPLPLTVTVKAEALEGVQSEIGLGIAKLHFELGAGNGSFAWAA